MRQIKNYNKDGIEGLVLQRKNRKTKTIIGLYASAQSFETDPELPWSTVCEDHSSIVCHENRKNAEIAMTFPDWCEECSKILYHEGLL